MERSLPKNSIKIIGFYLIIVLVILRFLIYPLAGSVKEKKLLMDEMADRYRLKIQIAERQQTSGAERDLVAKGDLMPYLYDKEVKPSIIQSQVLEEMIRLAEAKGLMVLNFEMMEPSIGKELSELSVLLRVKGQPKAFIETLKEMEKGKKIINNKSVEISKLGEEFSYALTVSVLRIEK